MSYREVICLKKNTKKTAVVVLIAAVLVIALISEIAVVFRITSQQTTESGSSRLEIISGELEDTIDRSRTNTMITALRVQPYMDDREALREYIVSRKAELLEQTGGECYNVYIAGKDWDIIPDFVKPDGYEVSKRSWYQGALQNEGNAYVTPPYVDAATGNMCYTVSMVLSDGETVVGLDYTMDNIRQHIRQMYRDGDQQALIVTDEGIIAGCSDEHLTGSELITELPEYAGIFSLAKSSDGAVHVKRHGVNLFAVRSGSGWYLIVNENEWSLYRTSYRQMLAMIFVSLIIFAVIIAMYFSTANSAKKAEDALVYRDNFIAKISAGLQEPLQRIIAGSSPENVRNCDDYGQEFENIRAAGHKLSDMIGEMVSYSSLLRTEKEKPVKETGLTIDKRFRRLILLSLLLVMTMSMYVNITATFRWGKGRMQEEVSSYTSHLNEWTSTQKSILDMFCSVISTHPEILEDYEGAVEYLDDITRQYPDISVSYIVNPNWEHTVYMNNGWEPDSDWHVEDRDWYIKLESSEQGWCISEPYFDEQTGLYCVTFAEKVIDPRTGEFIGNFGIDFYMDKLVDILGSSYSDEGYAFLADAEGEIINHPYGSYQMSENSVTNAAQLSYDQVRADGSDMALVRDYDGKLRVIMAAYAENSDFTVYVAKDIWNVYKGVLLYGVICLVVLMICTVAVYMLMNNLIRLQEKANRQLKDSADAAIAADEAKSTFLAQMSHEIRTPINAVLGMNEMILRECRDLTIRDYAENIQSAGRTLLSLINSILDFSKIEDGKMEIIPVDYETAAMVNDIVNSISTRAAEKGLQLKTNVDSKLPAKLNGDDMRIKQVISNLLTNAVKYTEKGRVTLTIKGEEKLDDKLTLYVEVADTGIGIREEDLDGLFESFKRLDEKRNRSIEGTGLGMSIVTRLLDMMNSELHVESIYGIGSTFWFRIEQGVADPEPMGDYGRSLMKSTSKSVGHIYAPQASVLVVDDNEMNLKVAASLMKLYGIVPDLADSGFKAVSMAGQKRYDIIFLDHMMPGMDGIETLKLLREEGCVADGSVVIALTANAIVGAREMYLNSGFDDYLSKPIESAALENKLGFFLPADKVSVVTEETKSFHDDGAEAADMFTAEEMKQNYALCPQINLMAGLGYCMDSKEFYLDTLKGYVQADKREELQKAFDEKDYENYRIIVHSIKSTSLTIGAQVTSEHAKSLEFAARDNDIELIEKRHDSFMDEYIATIDGVVAVLSNYFEE